MKNKIKISVVFLTMFLGCFCFSKNVSAAIDYSVSLSGNNLIGYVWNENIGWIKFDGTGYGVSKDDAGVLSGYAWSENVGWLSFNAADLAGCPDGACQAALSAQNQLSGWARFLSATVDSGNSGGWVRLNGTGYQAALLSNDSYAWSDDFGWIKFASLNPTADLTPSGGTYCPGANASLSWTSGYTVSCSSPDFETGGAVSGSVSVNVGITPPKVFSLVCTNGTIDATDQSSFDVRDTDCTRTILTCVNRVCSGAPQASTVCTNGCGVVAGDEYCQGKSEGNLCGPSLNWEEVAPE